MTHIATRIVALLLPLLLLGCGGDADHLTQQAELAWQNNRPSAALDYAQKALDQQPQAPKALLLKARALMGLNRLEAAGNTLRSALRVLPEDVPLRQATVDWAMLSIGAQLRLTDVHSDPNVAQRIEDALAQGRTAAEFLSRHSDAQAALQGKHLDAQLTATELTWWRMRLEASADPALQSQTPDTQECERQVQRLLSEVTWKAKAVLELAPVHSGAMELYAQNLVDRGHWSDLWTWVQTLAGRGELTATGAASAITAMMDMPATEASLPRRIALGQQLLDQLAPQQAQRAEAMTTRARLFHAAGDFARAQPLLEQAQQGSPQDLFVTFLRAQNAFGRDDHATAVALLEGLLRQGQDSPAVHVLYARALNAQGKPEAAVTVLRRCIELFPQGATARQLLLLILTEQGFFAQAQGDVDDYLRHFPQDPAALQTALRFELARGRVNEARRVLQSIEQIVTPTDDHLRILVDGYSALRDHAAAVRYARELAARRSDSAQDQLRLLGALLSAGQHDAAAAQAAQVRKAFGSDPALVVALAGVYVSQGQGDVALRFVEDARRSGAADAAALTLLHAQALASSGRYDQALAQLEAFLAEKPTDFGARALAWRIEQIAGRPDRAAAHLAAIPAGALRPEIEPALAAQAALRDGQAAQAISLGLRALVSGRPDPMLRLVLARAYEQAGESEMAQANLIGLVNAQPHSAMSWSMLTRFFAERGDYERGLSVVTELQDANPTLAGLSRASLLYGIQRYEAVVVTLEPVLTQLIAERSSAALTAADALAQSLVRIGRAEQAAGVYQQLIDAKLWAPQATLRRLALQTHADPQQQADELEALGRELTTEQGDLMSQVLGRLTELRRYDAAETLMRRWIDAGAPAGVLYRQQGRHLLSAQQPGKAAEMYRAALRLTPGDASTLRDLAQALQWSADYPAAERTLLELARMSPEEAERSRQGLAHLYSALGLHRRVLSFVAESGTQSEVSDAVLCLSAGRAAQEVGDAEGSRRWLEKVHADSPWFVAAQTTLALLELDARLGDEARTRLLALASEATHQPALVNELLAQPLRLHRTRRMIGWCGADIDAKLLPRDLAGRWLGVRALLGAETQDWALTQECLDQLSQWEPTVAPLAAGRVALLLFTGRQDQARQALVTSPALVGVPLSRLLEAVVSPTPTLSAQDPGLYTAMLRLIANDKSAAASALRLAEPRPGILLGEWLSTVESASFDAMAAHRELKQLALALAALDAGLPTLAQRIAEQVAQRQPTLYLAHSLRAQAVVTQLSDVGPTLAALRESFPDSALTAYLSGRLATASDDFAAALPHLERALRLEPGHPYLQLELADAQRRGGQREAALTLFETVARSAASAAVRALAGAEALELLLEEKTPDLPRAATLAAEQLRLGSPAPTVLRAAGWIEHLSGRHEAGLALMRQSLRALGSQPLTHYRLGAAYLAADEKRWAQYHLQEAAAGDPSLPGVSEARGLLAAARN